MKRIQRSKSLGIATVAVLAIAIGNWADAQKMVRRPVRAAPPKFQLNEFSGVFFTDPLAQLQGKPAAASPAGSDAANSQMSMNAGSEESESLGTGQGVWKELISRQTIEDLVKESKARLDGVITTPAKFAGGGYAESRKEFTLLASLMEIISEYPEDVRWKSSSTVARTLFARMAANCKVGTQPVYNEAKLRHQDLQDLLKGSKLTATAEETAWPDIADRGPSMQILEWSLRDNLAPATSNEDNFNDTQEDIVKYAELVAAYGQILQQEGMTDADDENYTELAKAMVTASRDVLKAVKIKDADMARTAVSRIDQSCNKCHDTYR